MPKNSSPRIAVISGMRTPFAKAGTHFKNYTALDLGVHAVKGLLAKMQLDPKKIDELIFGTVINQPKMPNLAREIVFFAKLPSSLPAYTVSNNCITGIEAITNIYEEIIAGQIEIGVAGGSEAMSDIPILFSRKLSQIFLEAHAQKTLMGKLKQFLKVRPRDLKPDIPSITEPSTGLTMGEHTEIMAKEWHVSRQEQDEVAYRSQKNAATATKDGRLKAEIFPLDGFDYDPILRFDTTMEKLAKLKPVFDHSPSGTITAGNSSPLTDGASALLITSEERAKKEGWEPLVYIKAFEYAAIDPKDGLLMGPALAVPRLLKKTGLTLADMDIVEMHEAFSAQIVCNLKAWEQGWKEPAIGKVPVEKLNPLGSSIAVGHPFAATGGRIVTTLANEMKRRNARYGLVSICAAGAMAAAMILERM